MCDILENNDTQSHVPHPHAIPIDESNKLLDGLKSEVGEILEVLVLEYDFAGTRTRTRE